MRVSLLSATVSMVSARLQQSNHYLSAEAATTLNLGTTPSHLPRGAPTLFPILSLNFVPCVCKFVCSHPNSGFWPLVYPPQLWCGSVRAATAISSRWCVALGRHMWSVRGQGPAQGRVGRKLRQNPQLFTNCSSPVLNYCTTVLAAILQPGQGGTLSCGLLMDGQYR